LAPVLVRYTLYHAVNGCKEQPLALSMGKDHETCRRWDLRFELMPQPNPWSLRSKFGQTAVHHLKPMRTPVCDPYPGLLGFIPYQVSNRAGWLLDPIV
jgi:hypothetical protein